MVVLYFVIANEVLKCLGMRYCETVSGVELIRLWEAGFVEVMFEGYMGSQAVKVWRRLRDKITTEDRQDKHVDEE